MQTRLGCCDREAAPRNDPGQIRGLRALEGIFIACCALLGAPKSFAQTCPGGEPPPPWVWGIGYAPAVNGVVATASTGCDMFLGYQGNGGAGASGGWTYISAIVPPGDPQTPSASSPNTTCAVIALNYGGSTSNLNFGFTAQQISGCPKFVAVATTPSKGEVCTKNCVNDPVNPALGNVYTTETDVEFSGGPGTVEFRRFYNSANPRGVDNVIGWRHSYERSIQIQFAAQTLFNPPPPNLVVSPQHDTPADACTTGFAEIRSAVSAWVNASASWDSANNVCSVLKNGVSIATVPIEAYPPQYPKPTAIEYDVTRDDGQVLRFTNQGGQTTAPPGTSLRLAPAASGFTLTDDDDTKETYNAAGQLQTITTRAGIVQTISYDGNGHFSGVTDSFGHSLTVTPNANGQIDHITVSGGGVVQYGYDAGLRLTSVTDLNGKIHSFGYSVVNGTGFLLTDIYDEYQVDYVHWDYDSQNRSKATHLAVVPGLPGGANATTLTYNADGSVLVQDALGAQRTFSYTRVGDINKVTGISGSQCPTCEESAATTYDAYGWVASRTDYNGNLTCYSNDSARGLELVRIEGFAPGSSCPSSLSTYTPASGTSQRKITTVWNTTWRIPATITEANRLTTITPDGAGNIHTLTITDLTVTPNVSRTWTYTYNSFGKPLTIDGPRTDVADVTTITYYTCTTGYQCGQIHTIQRATLPATTFLTYNAYGQPLTYTDENGVLVTLGYDADRRLTSMQFDTINPAYN